MWSAMTRRLGFVRSFAPGFPRGGADQRLEQVDLVVRMHVLQHGGEALQAHAGIHARLGQRMQHARLVPIELHEHQIPDFDVAVAVGVGRAGRAALDAGPMVVENFAAGAAGAGVGHLPEVVRGELRRAGLVADADAALGRHADFLRPDFVGLVVLMVDGGPQLVGGDAIHLGDQFPGVADGIALEVVAEAEIAEHLEKSMVARRVADVFQVIVLAAGAHAALRTGGARVGPLVVAEKDVLELHHAGVGEQQRRVVAGHQRRGGHDGVPLGSKVVEEFLADFSAFHDGCGGGRAREPIERQF